MCSTSRIEPVLRLAGMFLDLLRQFRDIKLSAFLRRELGAIVQVIEKMLIWIWASG